MTAGFNAEVNAKLGISTVQETVTVTGESPVVDTKSTGTKQTFTNERCRAFRRRAIRGSSSSRRPAAMDRENVGGNMSGQQSNYVSRGGNPTNNKWNIDGADITDIGHGHVADLLRLRRVRRNPDHHRRQRRVAAGRRRRHQLGHQERQRHAARLGALLRHQPEVRGQQHHRRAARPGRDRGQSDPGHQGLRRRAGGPIKKDKAWVWGSYGKRTSASASSTSTTGRRLPGVQEPSRVCTSAWLGWSCYGSPSTRPARATVITGSPCSGWRRGSARRGRDRRRSRQSASQYRPGR